MNEAVNPNVPILHCGDEWVRARSSGEFLQESLLVTLGVFVKWGTQQNLSSRELPVTP